MGPVPCSARRRLLAIAALALAQPAGARAAPSPDLLTGPAALPAVLVYGGDASFPPYEYLDERHQPMGLNVDLVRAVARELGIPVRVRLEPWARVRSDLEGGEVDVAAMYRGPRREREVDFAIAHELVYHEMFVRRGSPGLRSIADLAGKKVLVEEGTYSDDALTDLGLKDELTRAHSEPEALQALARGEGDAAVVTQAVGRPFGAREKLLREVIPTGPPVLLAEYCFVTRKGRPVLIERLNQGVAAIKASGEYQRIYDRWMRPNLARRFERLVLGMLAAAALAVLLVVTWNASLRRRVAQQTRTLRREFEEKAQVQAALAEAERSLRSGQKLEALGRLAGGVAHDFNNVLSVILSYGTSLREDLQARGSATADVDEILSASERAARLTRQLLAFSRATPVEAVRLDLCEAVTGMRTMLERLVGEHIRLEVSIPGRPVVVEAEATQLEQMLLNLAANARDAMPGGGVLGIRVEARALLPGNAYAVPAGDYAALTVSDTGVGMDGATLERIFEPFFTTKDPGHGTGLGLATVFAQARRLRGAVSVESAPGRGATFLVVLPLSPVRDLAAARASSQVDPAPTAVSTQVILLAEDDDALRRATARTLVRAGHRVIEARDGEAALEAAAGQPISLVVTDVVMPGRSGPSLAAELRRRRPDLPVLYLSGYVQEGQALELDRPGTAFLTKPCTARALTEAVRRLGAGAGVPERDASEAG